MAHFLGKDSYTFEDHPLFEKVRIAKLAGNAQNSPVGVSMLEFESGAQVPVHVHDDSIDSIYVMSGSAEIFADGKWRPVNAGDYCLVPAGEEHGVKNTGQEPLRLFIVHSPPLF